MAVGVDFTAPLLPDAVDLRRVLIALRKRRVAGVFFGGRPRLARAQGENILSATPPNDDWTPQFPIGFECGLLNEILAEMPRTTGALALALGDPTLRLGHAIGFIKGFRSGFTNKVSTTGS